MNVASSEAILLSALAAAVSIGVPWRLRTYFIAGRNLRIRSIIITVEYHRVRQSNFTIKGFRSSPPLQWFSWFRPSEAV